MVAKTVFSRTRWCATRDGFQLIDRAMMPGFPAAVPPSICPNALVYMNDWYCSRPSSSQVPARSNCSTRRASVPGEVVAPSRPRTSSIIAAFPLIPAQARLIRFGRGRGPWSASCLIAALPLLRNVEDFDRAAVLVGDVCLAPVGQHRDARWSFPGRDLGDDAVIRGVDHRDRVAIVVCREEVAPVWRVREVQGVPSDRVHRDV